MYFLGIDAGGTKTAFLLSDENGRIAARHRGGPAPFIGVGSGGLTAVLNEGVSIVCQRAGIALGDITFTGLGVPGYGEKAGGETEIAAACAQAGLHRLVCDCDCYAAWAGSLAMQPGVVIVAGTGAICYGADAAGQTARGSGWGAFCDEGSCRWLGEKLIQLYTRQADGRMPRTSLYDLFRRYFYIKEDLHFIYMLNHELAHNNDETAELQILLGQIYDAGDPHARALYAEAADELSLAARTVAARLRLSEGCAVSYSGGLFRAGARILDPLSDRVAAQGGCLRAPRFSPEQGAALMAMRQVWPERDFGAWDFTE